MSTMTYCFQCGLRGTPEQATGVDEDGEPACNLHRNKTIPAPEVLETIKTRPAPEEKIAREEKVMDKCFCGRDAGHTGRHIGSSTKKAARVSAAPAGVSEACVTVVLSNDQLNRFLTNLPMEAKQRMLQAFLAGV